MEATGEKAPGSLLGYIDGLVERLRALIRPAIHENLEESIHDARVATRRLKAAIELIRPICEEDELEQFGRVLRKLRRKLGPLRDLDVMMGHLREMPQDGADASASNWALEQMRLQRDEALAESRKELSPAKVLSKLGAWWAIHDVLASHEGKLEPMLLESLGVKLAEFQSGADAIAAKGHADPHAVRISGKALRYTLEMTAAAGHALPRDLLKTFKKMQDQLGLWHDHIVLTERVLALASEKQLAHHDAAAQRGVLSLAQHTLKAAERNLDHFGKLWRERSEELSKCILAISANEQRVPILSAEEEVQLREQGGEAVA